MYCLVCECVRTGVEEWGLQMHQRPNNLRINSRYLLLFVFTVFRAPWEQFFSCDKSEQQSLWSSLQWNPPSLTGQEGIGGSSGMGWVCWVRGMKGGGQRRRQTVNTELMTWNNSPVINWTTQTKKLTAAHEPWRKQKTEYFICGFVKKHHQKIFSPCNKYFPLPKIGIP